jgi:branched-chain amino acid transport system substrate-binding protein
MKQILCIVLAAILIAGCAQQPTGQTTGATAEIPIGAILILSGPGAAWGQSSVNGAQLAIEDINDAGGIGGKRLRLITEDTSGDPKTAIAAYQKLRDSDDTQFIIGTTWSREGLAVAPIAAQDDVVVVSPSLGVAAFNEQGENLFNVWPHDALLSAKLAEVVFADGHRKVAVMSAQDPWVADQTAAFAQRFTELGGETIIEEVTLDDKSQLQSCTKLMAADVDTIVFTNTITGDIAARRLQELGSRRPMYAITMGADTIKASAGAFDGLRFLSSLTPSPAFQARYAATYPGQVLDVGADSSYDAVMLLAQAMRETGSEDPATIAAYIRGVETFEGSSGTLVFDGQGGVTKEFQEFEVVEGVAVLHS